MSATGSNRKVVTLFGAFAAVVALWNTSLVTPLKILVVFFHEISHGLAAVLTGGSIVSLQITADEGGLAQTVGGIRFFIVSAGYVGSFLWGAALILAASRAKRKRVLTGALGILIGAVTIFYVRNLFGFFFGLATAALLGAAARKLNDRTNDFILHLVGVTSCSYAILDIWDDVIARSSPLSDASQLAAMTLIPSVVWGLFWIACTLAGLVLVLRRAV